MELINAFLPTKYTLVDCSDFHVGSPNCKLAAIEKMIKRVKSDPTCFLANKGDSIEAILPNDKRYTQSSVDVRNKLMTPQQQADWVIDTFTCIKDQILGWGFGNHELKLINTQDFGAYIAKGLGVPYGTYCYKLRIHDECGNLMHKFFMTHGHGSLTSNAKDDIQRDANIKANLKNKLARSGIADCIYMSMGHNHQLIVVDPTVDNRLYLTDDGFGHKQHYHVLTAQNSNEAIPENARWYSSTGSFMKLYSDPGSHAIHYAEVAGYAPSEIGWVELDIEDRCLVGIRKVLA